MIKSYLLLIFAFIIYANCSFVEVNKSNIASIDSTFFFPPKKYNFEQNAITKDKIALGKELFYDGNLSKDGTISCAECHNQSYAFTHHGHALSHGINDGVGIRNAPALINLAYQPTFLWDGGVSDLDLFPIVPITNPVEMGENMGDLLQKLQKNEKYVKLFKKAYGSEEITTERFLKAISQFLLQLESKNSKYDQYLSGKVNFSEDEKEGLDLFNQKGCNTCHTAPLFTDFSFRSNGLDTSYFRRFVDYGRARITEKNSDKFKFKVPTLRNISVTAPYMHDGRFSTLEEVLQHYAENMVSNPNLDPIFISNHKIGTLLTSEEQRKIIVFLKTLEDAEFLTNPEFGLN